MVVHVINSVGEDVGLVKEDSGNMRGDSGNKWEDSGSMKEDGGSMMEDSDIIVKENGDKMNEDGVNVTEDSVDLKNDSDIVKDDNAAITGNTVEVADGGSPRGDINDASNRCGSTLIDANPCGDATIIQSTNRKRRVTDDTAGVDRPSKVSPSSSLQPECSTSRETVESIESTNSEKKTVEEEKLKRETLNAFDKQRIQRVMEKETLLIRATNLKLEVEEGNWRSDPDEVKRRVTDGLDRFSFNEYEDLQEELADIRMQLGGEKDETKKRKFELIIMDLSWKIVRSKWNDTEQRRAWKRKRIHDLELSRSISERDALRDLGWSEDLFTEMVRPVIIGSLDCPLRLSLCVDRSLADVLSHVGIVFASDLVREVVVKDNWGNFLDFIRRICADHSLVNISDIFIRWAFIWAAQIHFLSEELPC